MTVIVLALALALVGEYAFRINVIRDVSCYV